MVNKKKVMIGLSGGVDSAVAAYLLLEQGYELIAGFMKNYADEENPDCHTREDRNMAIKVAQHLGISTFVIFDFRQQYDDAIVQYIYEGYKQGITPNPDVLCNSLIKFRLFLDKAKQLWCDAIATGHYARISQDQEKKFHLLKWVDQEKDQSYFLAGLDQSQLGQSLFPLGELTKVEVRNIAHDIWLPNADRKDSQWLCFIGKVPIRDFLQEKLPIKPGPIKDLDGNLLGEHQGAYFYTIGQREGLGIGWGSAYYVISKNVSSNELIVGTKHQQELYASHITAYDRHRTAWTYPLPLKATAKIRYRQPDQAVTLSSWDKKTIHLTFDSAQRAIAAGQIVAVYLQDELIASGTIQ